MQISELKNEKKIQLIQVFIHPSDCNRTVDRASDDVELQSIQQDAQEVVSTESHP